MTQYYAIKTSNTLQHHGIQGQKWGVKNGPPYPLDEKDHSVAEKKAENNSGKSKKSGIQLTERQKKAIKIGLIVAGSALAIYGGYKISNVINNKAIGKSFINGIRSGYKLKKFENVDHLKAIKDDIKAINKNKLIPGRQANCMYCTTAYDMRRRGFDVDSKLNFIGAKFEDLEKWYPGVKIEPVLPGDELSETAKNLEQKILSMGEGARGNLMGVYHPLFGNGGHSVAFEVYNNKVLIMDTQVNTLPYQSVEAAISRFDDLSLHVARLDNIVPDFNELKGVIKNL